MSKAYASSGVDITKGYESVERIKKQIQRTHRSEVLSTLGGFGGLFSLANLKMKHPVLVSGTDGVGTKLLVAQQAKRYHTVGEDLVAMCVNDVLAQGASPLFFLDYLAVGKTDPEIIEKLVEGIATGCVVANAALIGGETAEMPDLYSESEFDMAGFCVGVAEQENLLDATKVKEGDVLIGLKSAGIHSNGYSLVRKIFFKDHQVELEQVLEDGVSLVDHLLQPTRIYTPLVQPLLEQKLINGISHITGGGFIENIPRMYSEHLTAVIDCSTWTTPFIFNKIEELGAIPKSEMYEVFNMGIGMVLAVSAENVDKVCTMIPECIVIGHMKKNNSNTAIELMKLED